MSTFENLHLGIEAKGFCGTCGGEGYFHEIVGQQESLTYPGSMEDVYSDDPCPECKGVGRVEPVSPET